MAEAVARLAATAEPIEPWDAGAALDELDGDPAPARSRPCCGTGSAC